MRRIAFGGLREITRIKTEEEFDIAHSICKRTEHIAKEEVTEFDRIESGGYEPPL